MKISSKRQMKINKFLSDLNDLVAKHGLIISGCGCCGSPFLEDLERHKVTAFHLSYDQRINKYVARASNDIDAGEFPPENPTKQWYIKQAKTYVDSTAPVFGFADGAEKAAYKAELIREHLSMFGINEFDDSL